MKFDVKKFADLARLKLTKAESDKIEKDLGDVLDHFKELEKVDTKNVKPMTGGMSLSNVFRNDEESDDKLTGGAEQFPDEKSGYLKTPKVFE